MSSSATGEGCVLVTGASRGIGAAIALALAADGRPIAVNYNSHPRGADEVAAAIVDAGGRALPVQADVSDTDAVDAMFEHLEAELGPVLVLVNNAGVRNDRLLSGTTTEDWRRALDVNLTGAFNTIKRAQLSMVRARYGRIVNVSSIAATRPLAGQTAYAASKAGVEALTHAAALELARRGITVNAVAPGLVETEFVSEMTEEHARTVPARRVASPEEVAALVRFLVSDEAAYVNGAVVTVDGGLSAGLGVFRQAGGKPEAQTQMVGE